MVTICNQLKMELSDGKYFTEFNAIEKENNSFDGLLKNIVYLMKNKNWIKSGHIQSNLVVL